MPCSALRQKAPSVLNHRDHQFLSSATLSHATCQLQPWGNSSRHLVCPKPHRGVNTEHPFAGVLAAVNSSRCPSEPGEEQIHPHRAWVSRALEEGGPATPGMAPAGAPCMQPPSASPAATGSSQLHGPVRRRGWTHPALKPYPPQHGTREEVCRHPLLMKEQKATAKGRMTRQSQAHHPPCNLPLNIPLIKSHFGTHSKDAESQD